MSLCQIWHKSCLGREMLSWQPMLNIGTFINKTHQTSGKCHLCHILSVYITGPLTPSLRACLGPQWQHRPSCQYSLQDQPTGQPGHKLQQHSTAQALPCGHDYSAGHRHHTLSGSVSAVSSYTASSIEVWNPNKDTACVTQTCSKFLSAKHDGGAPVPLQQLLAPQAGMLQLLLIRALVSSHRAGQATKLVLGPASLRWEQQDWCWYARYHPVQLLIPLGDQIAADGSWEQRESESPFSSTPACRHRKCGHQYIVALPEFRLCYLCSPQTAHSYRVPCGGWMRCPWGQHPACGLFIYIKLSKVAIETKGEWGEMKK